MIVVQFFTCNQDAPRHNIGRSIRALEITIAPVMADAVDDARGEQWRPGHLHSPDCQANRTEQCNINQRHQRDAQGGMAAVDVALDPVIRTTRAITINTLALCGGDFVRFRALPEDLLEALYLRTVRIIGCFTNRVMLAVDGCPFSGDHAGGQPQPETEKMLEHGMQIHRPVRRVTVQIHRD